MEEGELNFNVFWVSSDGGEVSVLVYREIKTVTLLGISVFLCDPLLGGRLCDANERVSDGAFFISC